MAKLCSVCGEKNCNDHEMFIGKPVKIDQFSGSTPPEIFIGRWNYPNVYTGILAPQDHGDKQILSSPEIWHKNKMPISDILRFRNQLIYGRTKSSIKKLQTKFLGVLKEVAMTHKSVSTEFKLKKSIRPHNEKDIRVPLISNAAPISSARLEQNAPVKKKIDYLVNDTEVKSALAINELHKSNINTSSIIKILSAGLLGMKKNRRLVPTRWSITAVDDTISKIILQKIKEYQTISDFQVFSAEYIGNHYEFLLLPDKYSFEVLEKRQLSKSSPISDYETFFPRKKYADKVTGAYYANRLALVEYLNKIKRQSQCLVIREIRPDYYAPLGVGILREISREAFKNKPKKFNTLKEALEDISTRIRQPLSNYTNFSWLLKNFGKQSRITQWF